MYGLFIGWLYHAIQGEKQHMENQFENTCGESDFCLIKAQIESNPQDAYPTITKVTFAKKVELMEHDEDDNRINAITNTIFKD